MPSNHSCLCSISRNQHLHGRLHIFQYMFIASSIESYRNHSKYELESMASHASISESFLGSGKSKVRGRRVCGRSLLCQHARSLGRCYWHACSLTGSLPSMLGVKMEFHRTRSYWCSYMIYEPPYLGGVLMALTLCRKKNSIGCQDHGFFSTNCQPTCHFSTNCQSNLCLQYASGSRTTSFKKYKKTLCREVFFAPFFSTMCHFFSSMRCPGFFRFFKKKTPFLPVVVADTL